MTLGIQDKKNRLESCTVAGEERKKNETKKKLMWKKINWMNPFYSFSFPYKRNGRINWIKMELNHILERKKIADRQAARQHQI